MTEISNEQALAFLGHAFRNIELPPLSKHDLHEVADGLSWFARQPSSPTVTGEDVVERANKLAAEIMTAVRREKIDCYPDDERMDEFEARTLVPMLLAAIPAQMSEEDTDPNGVSQSAVERAREICASVFEEKANVLAGAVLPNRTAIRAVREQADSFRQGQKDDCEQMRIAIAALATQPSSIRDDAPTLTADEENMLVEQINNTPNLQPVSNTDPANEAHPLISDDTADLIKGSEQVADGDEVGLLEAIEASLGAQVDRLFEADQREAEMLVRQASATVGYAHQQLAALSRSDDRLLEALAGLIEGVERHCNEPGGGGISGFLGARLSDARTAHNSRGEGRP